MANGAAVALHLVLDPPATETAVAAAEIGQATAAAAVAMAWGILSYHQAGRLDPAAKEAGGTKLARVSVLMLDHADGDDDFTRKARAAAKPLLRAHLDAGFFQRYSPEQGDAALDFYIDSVFEVVTRTVADERAFRAAMAN